MAKGTGGSDKGGSSGGSSSGGSKGGSSSSSSGSKGGSTSSNSASKGGSTGSTGSTSSSRNSGGGYSGFGGGGGEGGPGRSSGSSVGGKSSSSPSSSSPAGGSRAASGGGAMSSAGSSTSSASRGTTSSTTTAGRTTGASATAGRVGGGLMGAAGLTGSGLADKGGRVTGGFDSGRFGDTPAADKGGRVTGAQTAGKASASPDPGRFGGSVTAEKGGRVAGPSTTGSISRQPAASVGRQSSINGQYNNGGINAGQVAGTARVGNGLAAGISAPSVSARAAETQSMASLAASRTQAAGTPRRAEDASMAALSASRQPVGSANYGITTAAKAREAEDLSMAKHGAWQGALDTIKSVESKRHGYDAVGYASSYGKPNRPDLQTMSIRDVMDWQEKQDRSAGKGYQADRTYVGAYQMGKATLGEAARRTGISLDAKFSKATQDYLAQDLVDNRARQATRNGELTPDRLAHSMAKEWAGLPTANGRSYYDGRAGNKAGISYNTSLNAAKGLTDTGAVGPGAAKGGRVTAPARTTEAPTTVATPTSRPSTPAAERFSEKYLGQPSVPTPTARPDQKPARSTVDKVVAGAIDLGVGMIPGVGPAAAIYSAAAPMLGLPTVGDLALNMRDRSSFDLKTALRSQDGEMGGEREARLSGAQPVEAEEVVAEAAPASAPVAASTFAEKYLAFSDPTPRPTPSQKWGGSGANDVAYSL